MRIFSSVFDILNSGIENRSTPFVSNVALAFAFAWYERTLRIQHLQKCHGKDTVRTRMNKSDPRNPPTMVMYSRPASWFRYNCIPAKSKTDNVVDRRKETALDTAEIFK